MNEETANYLSEDIYQPETSGGLWDDIAGAFGSVLQTGASVLSNVANQALTAGGNAAISQVNQATGLTAQQQQAAAAAAAKAQREQTMALVAIVGAVGLVIYLSRK